MTMKTNMKNGPENSVKFRVLLVSHLTAAHFSHLLLQKSTFPQKVPGKKELPLKIFKTKN